MALCETRRSAYLATPLDNAKVRTPTTATLKVSTGGICEACEINQPLVAIKAIELIKVIAPNKAAPNNETCIGLKYCQICRVGLTDLPRQILARVFQSLGLH